MSAPIPRSFVQPAACPPVVLGAWSDTPLVRGRSVPRLTRAQYCVVKALLEAGPNGLSKDALDEQSGHPDARKILKRLSDSSDDWASVISLPGKKGLHYRLV